MAERKVIVELQLADRNAVSELGKLQVETRQYQQSLKLLNSIVDENGKATVRQQQQIGELTAKITRNNAVAREMKNELGGLTAAGLRFRDKMAEASIEAIRQSGVLGKLDAQYATLEAEIAKGTAVIDANKAAMVELRTEYKKGELTAAEYKAQLALMKAENGQVAASNSKLEADLKGVGTQITSLDKKVEDLTADFKAGRITAEEFKRSVNSVNTEVAKQGGLITNGIKDLRSYALGFVGVIAAAQGIARITGELFDLSGEIEKTDARNKAIAGDSLPQFEAAAEATANAIGLTRREYVSLAADQALRLKQLGLEGDLVTELSTQTVEFSEKLSDFSAGELTTEQAASLLNDALTGQTKGLKALGINVKASKDEIAAQAQELMRSKGLTEEQATAVATLQLAFDATTESMQAFGAETLSIDEAQDQATAQLNEAKEALAQGLAPAFVLATQAGAGFVDMLSKVAAIQFGGASGVQSVLQDFVKNANVANTEAIQKLIKEGDQERLNLLKAQAIRQFSDLAKAQKEQPGNVDIELGLRRLKDIILQLDAATTGSAKAQTTLVTETGPVVTTMASLRAELKSLKDAREDLDVTDTEGLKTNEASIAALEKQIAALEVTKEATKKLTEAEQARLALQKEMLQVAKGQADVLGTVPAPTGMPFETRPAMSEENFATPILEAQDRQLAGVDTTNAELNDLYQQDVENYRNAQDEKLAAQQANIAGAANLVGSIAGLFEEESAEYKAFATIQSLISTYLGASMALTDKTIPNTFARIAAAAVVVFNGLANVRRIQGFEEGGYTAKRPSDHEEVGSVRGMPFHANEWFAPAWQVRHPTYGPIIASLEKARKSRGMRSDRSGFFTGGGAYTFTKGGGGIISAPRTTSATIASADLSRLISSIDMQPVVRVTDINRGQKTVRVTDRMSTL